MKDCMNALMNMEKGSLFYLPVMSEKELKLLTHLTS